MSVSTIPSRQKGIKERQTYANPWHLAKSTSLTWAVKWRALAHNTYVLVMTAHAASITKCLQGVPFQNSFSENPLSFTELLAKQWGQHFQFSHGFLDSPLNTYHRYRRWWGAAGSRNVLFSELHLFLIELTICLFVCFFSLTYLANWQTSPTVSTVTFYYSIIIM